MTFEPPTSPPPVAVEVWRSTVARSTRTRASRRCTCRPPGVPRFRNEHVYPLVSDLAKARALASRTSHGRPLLPADPLHDPRLVACIDSAGRRSGVARALAYAQVDHALV